MTTLMALLGVMTMPLVPGTSVEERGLLRVEILNLRSSRGQIVVSLYNRADGFPRDTKAVYSTVFVGGFDRKLAKAVFHDLPLGDYAVAVLHDENSNGGMDYNFLKLPKEGFGFSNDVQPRFKVPSFEEAKITLRTTETTLSVRMNY
jgi:uncharacterized protein (DUF2141 family)